MVSVEPGPEFKSRYEVLEELGKGRFGVVHKVVDKLTNQKLAAKFIKCRTAKDRDKVQDEIDIMNILRHQKLLQMAAAFENPRDMVMIMEYISGGELFERVVADDFTLTEKDCILFMRQICEGVAYMHSQNVVHLDLKPENIMCHTRTSHEIKIIDFGLAQTIDPDKPIRVLFGTPEFIPPEIINYEPIGVESDMWSLGVICYVLLSGLSPFMGDNDSETFANITRADYDFEDEAFNTVSQNARDFIAALLLKRKEDRLSAEQCLKHIWLDPETHQETVVLSTDKLKKFIIRRKWQKTGNAIRALGRMATLSASRRNSANSTPNTPRPSLSGNSVPRMSSLNEEDAPKDIPPAANACVIANDLPKIDTCVAFDEEIHNITNKINELENSNTINEVTEESTMNILNGSRNESTKVVRTRACSERSDSGISDCSSHLTSSSCTSTPLLGKKFCINEESEYNNDDDRLFTSSKQFLVLNNRINEGIERSGKNQELGNHKADVKIIREDDRSAKLKAMQLLEEKQQGLSLKLSSKIESFNGNSTLKNKSPNTASGLKRLPIYTSRTVAGTIKKFDKPHEPENPLTTKCDAPNRPKTVLCNNLSNSQSVDILSASKPKIHINSPTSPQHDISKVEKIVEKLSHTSRSEKTTLSPPPTVRYRCPSPSLLRKTQAVLAKEQCNEYYMAKQALRSPSSSPRLPPKFHNAKPICPKSPVVNIKNKPKSESYQKAAAFWNSSKT